MKKQAKQLVEKICKESDAVRALALSGDRYSDKCGNEFDNALFQRDCAVSQYFEEDYELSQYEDTLTYLKTLHQIVKLKKSLKPIFG
jgi:hypothetical protein